MKKLYFLFFFIVSWVSILSANEGFLENTLVFTPSGYQKIQDLYIGDIVYDQNLQEKIITNNFQYFADQYIQLNINNELINCALNQKLYVTVYATWIEAKHLTESECNAIKIINENVLIYCITVQDHIFQMSQQNIVAHNSAAALIIPSIIFNFIELAQPVLILLGITQSLYYFSSYAFPLEQNNTIMYQVSPKKIYFDSRYQQLEKLKQEITSIHTALKTIKCQFQDQYSFLDYQKLITKNLTLSINLTAQYESELDFEEQLQLTEIRKKILEDLEIEICNIQISIGLFINEILHRKNETIITYNNFIQANKDPLFRQVALPRNTISEIVITYYEHVLTCIMYVTEIENRTQECTKTIQLFQSYKNNQLIKQTTNIIPVLTKEKNIIEKSQQVINQAKKDNHKKLQSTFDYCTSRMVLPDITHKITTLKNKLHQKIQQKPKEKPQCYSKSDNIPKKEDPDDREIPRIYVEAKYHGKYATALKSPAPKNGHAALAKSYQVKPGIRIAIDNNEIVILLFSQYIQPKGSEWHGYVTTYEQMYAKPHMREFINLLIEIGVMRPNGKLI